jgi:hypothetical protein
MGAAVSPDPTKIVDRSETCTGEDMGECPCGRAISVDLENHSVMHALPTCETFDRLGVTDYLQYVRAEREHELAGYIKRFGAKA